MAEKIEMLVLTDAEGKETEVLVLTDAEGNYYIMPRNVVEECRVPDDAKAKVKAVLDDDDVGGFDLYTPWDFSGLKKELAEIDAYQAAQERQWSSIHKAAWGRTPGLRGQIPRDRHT